MTHPTTIMRVCSVCGQEKPRNTAFTRIEKRDRLLTEVITYTDDCKVCRAAAKAESMAAAELTKEEREKQKKAERYARNRERETEMQRQRRAKAKQPKPRITGHPWMDIGANERPNWSNT